VADAGRTRAAGGEPGPDTQRAALCAAPLYPPEAVRQSIAAIVNRLFEARLPQFWGDDITACASDSRHFRAWDQNLLTEWHVRYGKPGIMIYLSAAADK